MPPKNQPNGFYMYMQSERRKIQQQTNRAPSMKEMAGICAATWKTLSGPEKEKYEQQAKLEKQKLRNAADKDRYRMDNQRRIIADRKNPIEEAKKRRAHEAQVMLKSWSGQDVRDIEFHLIDIQVMYDDKSEDHHLPVELGMVRLTLNDGIKKDMHRFIDPGQVPEGNRHLALKHSELTHQIPLDYEKADSNFLGLWMQMENFLVEDPRRDEMPPLFCLSLDCRLVESCLEYMHYRANTGEPNRLYKVYCIEDLITCLMMQTGSLERKPVESQILDNLRQNRWDYNSSIRCPFHEEIDCAHCSISIVKRYSFVLFDLLSKLLDFKLTKNHMPDETEQQFTVMHRSAFTKNDDDRRGPRAPRDFGDSSRSLSVRSSSPPSFVAPAPQMPSPPRAWGPPRVNRVEVPVHEESDDSDEEDEALYTDEVRSTSDKYDLKELRKPKTPSMLLAQGGMAGVGRGQSVSYGRGIDPVLGARVPMRPVMHPAGGDGLRHPGMRMIVPPTAVQGMPTFPHPIRAPPGLAPPPGFGPLPDDSEFPPLGMNPYSNPAMPSPLQAQPTAAPVGRGRGLAVGRGRGKPPQASSGLPVGRGYSR